jgi:hypothetical protein
MLLVGYWTITVYNGGNIFNDTTRFGLLFEPIVLLILTITLFVFTPLTVLSFWRLKKGGNLKILNKIFRIICAIILIIFAIAFILSVVDQIYYRPSGFSFWSNLWYLTTYHLSWGYFSDINFGFINDIKQILVFLPHLIIVGLLYSAFRTNKLLNTSPN